MRVRVTLGAASAVVALALAGCGSSPSVGSSDSGDFVILTSGSAADAGGQTLAEAELARAGSCIGLKVGDQVTLAVFPPATTVDDSGAVTWVDRTRSLLGDSLRAGGGAVLFEELPSEFAGTVPEDCETPEIFFISHVE